MYAPNLRRETLSALGSSAGPAAAGCVIAAPGDIERDAKAPHVMAAPMRIDESVLHLEPRAK
jgi:hypothetical protein